MPNPYLADALRKQQDKRAALVAESEGYDALTVPKLHDLIAARNGGPVEDDLIAPEGNLKADLVAALEADDKVESE